MSFANPIWLWGLTGLAIPFAIHLLSRKEGKVIRIGSLRHLSESTTQQFKSIRLNEVLLLALRCLLILLIVLLLSGLQIGSGSKSRWILVEPPLMANDLVKRALDSLTSQGYVAKAWTAGFPDLSAPGDEMMNHWALLDQLTSESLDEAVVISASRISQFQNDQRPIPTFVKWIQLDEEPGEFVLTARQVTRDSVLVRTATTAFDKTKFTSTYSLAQNLTDPIKVAGVDTLKINFIVDEGFQRDEKMVRSALRVIERETRSVIQIRKGEKETSSSEWTFWLSENQPPSLGRSIIYRPASSKNTFAQIGQNQWTLTRRLDAGVENISWELAHILLPRLVEKERADSLDQRVMPESMRWSSLPVTTQPKIKTAAADVWLLLLFALTFVVERFISFQKRL